MNSAERQPNSRSIASPGGSRYTRRTVLRLVFGAAATATGLAGLVACGGGAPTATGAVAVTSNAPAASGGAASAGPIGSAAPSTSVATAVATTRVTAPASQTTAGTPGVATPAGTPAASGGKIRSSNPRVPDAYTQIPAPFKTVDAPPGRGGKFTSFQIAFGAAPPPRDQNLYWREFEKRLNATIDPIIAPAASYTEKLASVTASGDIPDLTCLFSADQYGVALQQGAYTDLTPFLSGDALKEYPNLAILPADLWENVKIKGKIYGVPRSRYFTSSSLPYRRDWAVKLGLQPPKNADEFRQFLEAFTKRDPDGDGQQNTWGLGGQNLDPFNLGYLRQMFRVPNDWRKNADNTLTYYIETPEFAQTLAYARSLYEAGVVYPQVATASVTQAKSDLAAGKFGAFGDGIAGIPGLRAQGLQVSPSVDIDVLVPPGHDGGQAVTYNTTGFQGFVAIPSKVGKDTERVKELLRIANYYSAPFGSEEYVFTTFGLEGVHYRRTPQGTFQATEQGKAEVAILENLADGAQVCYFPVKPDDGPYLQQKLEQILAIGIDNPVSSAFSTTQVKQGAVLTQLLLDRFTAIITGREPLSALDAVVRDWKSRGGDQIRNEYAEELK